MVTCAVVQVIRILKDVSHTRMVLVSGDAILFHDMVFCELCEALAPDMIQAMQPRHSLLLTCVLLLQGKLPHRQVPTVQLNVCEGSTERLRRDHIHVGEEHIIEVVEV